MSHWPRRVRILLRVALVMGALLWPRLATADIVYIYDALDRLARVIREDGEAASYHYDAVGNLLSITRESSVPQSTTVTSSPPPVGRGSTATVTLSGFNLFGATVTGSSGLTVTAVQPQLDSVSVQLNVAGSAPLGPGSLTVQTPYGSAVVPITVQTGIGITSMVPSRAVPGMAVTLTGSPFDPTPANNTVRVNGLAATVLTASATSLMFRVPAGATSGPVEVTTPTASGTGATPLTVHSMPPDRLQVPTMDLLAYWTFDQDGRDDAGSLDLTLQGGVTTETDGMLGMALDFQNNPSQIGVRTADAAAFNFGATPFTVALWVRWTSTTGEQVLLDKCDNMCAGPGWTLTKIGPGISISNARNFAEFAGPSETAQITLLLITIEISHSLDRQNPSYALALSGAFGLGLAAYKTASPTAATIDVPLAGGGCPTKSQSKSAR